MVADEIGLSSAWSGGLFGGRLSFFVGDHTAVLRLLAVAVLERPLSGFLVVEDDRRVDEGRPAECPLVHARIGGVGELGIIELDHPALTHGVTTTQTSLPS